MTIEVSILVLTYNRLSITSTYLPTIVSRVGDINHEILVWDNGSTDGTLDWLWEFSKLCGRITKLYTSYENFGVEAINFLARRASGKYILKVDDDILVPSNFAANLVSAHKELNEHNLAYLAYDMRWGKGTFATRSGMRVYANDLGTCKLLSHKRKVYVSYKPDRWMINGACRLCLKDTFWSLGGHPPNRRYGVDRAVSLAAAQANMWIAYLSDGVLAEHHPKTDSPSVRRMKDAELHNERIRGNAHV